MKTLFVGLGITVLGLTGIAAEAEPPVICRDLPAITTAADGGLRPVVGVHNIQVVRANRTNSPHADGLLHSYMHQPMLAYWKGKFYLEYLSDPRSEHEAPGYTSLATSTDGYHWEKPRVVFPPISLPDGNQSLCHQRMGFYVSPEGRLLVLAFYGKPPEPNDGTGLGRAVREVYENGSFGPIYFIRPNAKQPYTEFKLPYPLYSESKDAGFVAACNALLSNKLMTAQWWEEDQLDESGFYTIKGKALSFIHRPDGSVLGVWKNALVATTTDAGKTWTEKQFGTHLPNNASKYWLQKTADNRYALFLNPTSRQRLPLAVMVSDDCSNFSGLLAVHGELPDQRFPGKYKNLGPQYVRGIVEGNGTPPDSGRFNWVTYSVNKEDIWISRLPAPLTAKVDAAVHDDFEDTSAGALPELWNIYSPAWAPVSVVETNSPAKHALELRDEDPYDYARAIRVFPETHGLKASFKVFALQTNARLEIELASANGARPFVVALAEDGHIWVNHEGVWNDNGPYAASQWISFELAAPTKPTADRISLKIDGKPAKPSDVGPAEAAATVERLSFRTGAFRYRGEGKGVDLPAADVKAPLASFLIDDVIITPEK
ncbi:MAG: exo-alpha-sialidase [Nibricoccus sp.]